MLTLWLTLAVAVLVADTLLVAFLDGTKERGAPSTGDLTDDTRRRREHDVA